MCAAEAAVDSLMPTAETLDACLFGQNAVGWDGRAGTDHQQAGCRTWRWKVLAARSSVIDRKGARAPHFVFEVAERHEMAGP